MLADMGLRRVAGIPHIDRARAALLESAEKVCARLLAGQADSPKGRFLRAYLCWLSGDLDRDLGRHADAAARFDEALALVHALRAEGPAEVPPQSLQALRARVHDSRGRLLLVAGEPDRARAEQQQAVALTEELLAASPADPDLRFAAAVGCVNLSIALQAAGDRRGQELYLARALRYSEGLIAAHPEERAYAYIHAFILNAQGAFCIEGREPARAVPYLEKSVELWRRVLKEDPANLEYSAGLARTLGNLAVAWRLQGYVKRAAEPAEESLKLREGLARNHPDVPEFALELAIGSLEAGQLDLARRDASSAGKWYTRAIETIGDPGKDPRRRSVLRKAYQMRATVHRVFRRTRDAAADLGRAADLATGADRAAFRAEAAVLLATAGEPSPAAEAAEAALKEADGSPESRFDAARALALAAAKSEGDVASEYAARAVQVLEGLAADRFFHDADRRKALDAEPDFQSLRGRADFDALRARVRGP
jgi:tetratricopeptide (TPR) repeat protein